MSVIQTVKKMLTEQSFGKQMLKGREGDMRRWATSQGLALQKARTRNERNPSFGRYRLAMRFRRRWHSTGVPVYGAYGDAYCLTLDMVEDFLQRFCSR